MYEQLKSEITYLDMYDKTRDGQLLTNEKLM